MAANITQEDKNTMKVNIEVDCPCDVGICSHSMEEVTKALQQAYAKGVRDGATGAMDDVKKFLRSEYPEEYAKVEKTASSNKARAN